MSVPLWLDAGVEIRGRVVVSRAIFLPLSISGRVVHGLCDNFENDLNNSLRSCSVTSEIRRPFNIMLITKINSKERSIDWLKFLLAPRRLIVELI